MLAEMLRATFQSALDASNRPQFCEGLAPPPAKTYFAFRELRRVVRTALLLD